MSDRMKRLHVELAQAEVLAYEKLLAECEQQIDKWAHVKLQSMTHEDEAAPDKMDIMARKIHEPTCRLKLLRLQRLHIQGLMMQAMENVTDYEAGNDPLDTDVYRVRVA